MEEPLYYVLKKLIYKNNIRIHEEELKLQLLNHPSYPALASLTEVLDHFGIENIALHLSTNLTTLLQLPDCFIADVRIGEDKQLALIQKKKDKIKVTFNQKEKEWMSQEVFLDRWKGDFLVIEKDDEMDEFVETLNPYVIKWPFYIIGCLVVGYFTWLSADVFQGVHYLLSLLGLGLSILIVKQELGMNSILVNHFCRFTEQVSCDAVLHSSGANLSKHIKLSDISLVVFATYCLNWLLVFVSGISNHQLIALASLFTIPFLVYSIFYQYWIIKKWCSLCLGVALILLIQLAMVLTTELTMPALSIVFDDLLILIISLLLSMGIWSILRPLLENKKQGKKIAREYSQLKHNFFVFNTFYSRSQELSTSVSSIPGEITLGNKNAALDIVLVTNPLCYKCKEVYQDVEQLLRYAQDRIKVSIRFNVNVLDEENVDFQIASHLLQIYATQDEFEIRAALEDVFSKSIPLNHWLKKQKNALKPINKQILKNQREWCHANNIHFTPVLYMNGKVFPAEYEATDLLYFIDDLIELENVNMVQLIKDLLPQIIKRPSLKA